jgi:LPS export ABC transporter protein LptC
MTGVKFSEVNNNQIRWTLDATTARFVDGETRIYLDGPKIHLFENGAPSSDIDAETGFLNMAQKDAQIETNVKVVSKSEAMTMLTSRLFFSSEKNIIWTEDPVTILRGDTITHGKGLTAKPDLSEIEITQQETTPNPAANGKKSDGS